MIKQILSSILVLLVISGARPVQAAPATCNWTSARAKKDAGPTSSPSLCAISVCRQVGWWTYKIDDAVITPGMPAPMLIKYHVEAGSWAGLPACPTWTNTSTWSAP